MNGATWPYPRWIAHRGAGKLAPENTLAAFRRGAAYGYRMFECDVKLSADGVPFLMHDATLDRTSDGRGPGGAEQWLALSQLDAGGWHSRTYAGEPPPSLGNVARFCLANGYHLNIEIKPTPGAGHHTGEVVAEHAARLWSASSVPPLLTSFDTTALVGAREKQPGLPLGLLLDALTPDWIDTARALDCLAIVCNHALWNTSTVTEARSAGFRCLSYTVNDAVEARRLVELGTDGIITDRVDLFSPA